MASIIGSATNTPPHPLPLSDHYRLPQHTPSTMKLVTKDDASPPPPPPTKRLSLDTTNLSTKDRYKLCALAALLLLALWSLLTGSLSLTSSSSSSVPAPRLSSSNPGDLDVLEVAEMEKVVNRLWNVYRHGYGGAGPKTRLPKFWEEAFQAAYESLVSDAPSVRDDAVFEIAKMSLFSMDLLAPPTRSSGGSRKLKRR